MTPNGDTRYVAISQHVLDQLLSDVGGDRETLHMLIGSLLEEAPKLLAEGRKACTSGDVASCQRAYHTLKGNAYQFGAMELGDAAKDIEHPAKTGTLPSGDQLDRVDALLRAAETELRAKLA